MTDGLLGAIVRRFGRDGDGRLHEAPPRLDLPEETFHCVYDEETGIRFAHLRMEGRGLYREMASIKVPAFAARYLDFRVKLGEER